jgi:chromate transporter
VKTTLRELALLFLKLGTVAFGGPAAHIAMMEDEVVRRRRWLTRDEFLDYLGATNLIPGPNSTELAIHIGHARAGWPGLLVAGTCFILPAALIVSAVAWAYVRYGSLPLAVSLAYWIKPTVIAVVVQALWGLGRTALKTRTLVVVGIAAIAASLMGVNELAVLFGAGAAMILLHLRRSAVEREAGAMMALATLPIQGTTASIGSAFALWPLFGTFVKIGSVLFGSGYVLLAFLRADFVERLHWLTERQLLDAVAVGQVTPGPVFTTATFIGYVLGGPAGAAVATMGIFLPAFVFVALSSVLLPRLRRSPLARAVLDGVNVASLALMAIVTVQLSAAAIVDVTTASIAAVSMLLLFRFRVNSAWLVIGAGVAGLLIGPR